MKVGGLEALPALQWVHGRALVGVKGAKPLKDFGLHLEGK